MTNSNFYPVGTADVPWGADELDLWRSRQSRLRRYDVDVVPRIDALTGRYENIVYGALDYVPQPKSLLRIAVILRHRR
ncbi:hypothetical protein WBQ88_12105 [Sphingopyxis sp. CCNWLW253]|uniref:hypothetical protein n=1 Tax=unclassified Sphingopyxis TaxID=2614943 RepID=UPI00301314E1